MTAVGASLPVAEPFRRGFWRRFWGTRLPGALLVVLLVLAWEVPVRSELVQVESLPAPSRVLAVLLDAARAKELLVEFGGSLVRMAWGYGLGVSAGVVVGLAMGYSRLVYRTLELTLDLLRVVPAPAFIPPLVLILGIDDPMKIAIVALAVFWPVMLNTMHGVRGVEQGFIDTARTFRIPGSCVLRKVVLPAAAPLIASGMRISLALCLIVTVVAEMIAGSGGIGFYILTMEQAARVPEMYAGVLVLAALGYALNRVFLVVERLGLHWYFEGARIAP